MYQKQSKHIGIKNNWGEENRARNPEGCLLGTKRLNSCNKLCCSNLYHVQLFQKQKYYFFDKVHQTNFLELLSWTFQRHLLRTA